MPDPSPTDLDPYSDPVDPEDLPVLVTALRESCPWPVTFNVRHYQPVHPGVTALRPGGFLLRVRDRLARPTDEGEP